MYKIGIVGDFESVKGFAAIGLSVCPVDDQREALTVIKRLIKEEFAIIYITEDLYVSIYAEIQKFKELSVPSIISIPGIKGKSGIGMEDLRNMSIRAIGSDIVFNQN